MWYLIGIFGIVVVLINHRKSWKPRASGARAEETDRTYLDDFNRVLQHQGLHQQAGEPLKLPNDPEVQ